MYHIFIHPSINGLPGCFHARAIGNSAAVNTGVSVSVSFMVFSGICPGVGLPGHMVDLFLVFKESTHCTVYKELSVTREDGHNRMSRGKAATLYKQHYLNQGIYVI